MEEQKYYWSSWITISNENETVSNVHYQYSNQHPIEINNERIESDALAARYGRYGAPDYSSFLVGFAEITKEEYDMALNS